MAAGQVVLGIILALCGGASLALAMVTQRYALSFPAHKVPFLGCTLPRNFVWFVGLVIYGAANGLYAAAQLFGPLSLLAGVFTTLLIWNMLFARLLLGEQLTAPRIYGATVILAGVIMCIAATPSDVETEFTPQDIRTLSSRAVGAAYIGLLLVLVLGSVAAICWYEAKYPTNPATNEGQDTKEGPTGDAHSPVADVGNDEVKEFCDEEEGEVKELTGDGEEEVKEFTGEKEAEDQVTGGSETHHQTSPRVEPAVIFPQPLPEPVAIQVFELSSTSELEIGVEEVAAAPPPPAWLDRSMGLVYPGSLGLDEGIAHLTMKASVAMLDSCGTAGACTDSLLVVFVLVWVLASIATLWWLRRVFSRYETTLALPVEYGTVNAVSACSGLLFYREASLMTSWQLALMIVGVGVILIGIAVGRRGGGSK